VSALKASLDGDDKATAKTVEAVTGLVSELARGVRGARADKFTQSAQA
jgi:hypothetical protein